MYCGLEYSTHDNPTKRVCILAGTLTYIHVSVLLASIILAIYEEKKKTPSLETYGFLPTRHNDISSCLLLILYFLCHALSMSTPGLLKNYVLLSFNLYFPDYQEMLSSLPLLTIFNLILSALPFISCTAVHCLPVRSLLLLNSSGLPAVWRPQSQVSFRKANILISQSKLNSCPSPSRG